MQLQGITRNLMICVLAACFGTQFQFFNVTVGNNAATIIKSWFNQSYFEHYRQPASENKLSWIYSVTTSCMQIGCVVSSLATKVMAERLGRRKTLMLTAFAEAVGAILVGLSKLATSLELFGVGRFVIGLGFGMGTGVASMFISELAPIKVRGAVGTIQQIFIGFGMAVGFAITLPQLLGTDTLWPIAFVVPAIPALVQFFIMWRVHDSPKYLLLTMKNRDASMQSLHFYKGPEAASEAIQALETERDQVNNSHRVTFRQVLTKRIYRRPLIISFMVMFSIQFTGIAAIMSYSKTIFNDAGLDEQASELASVGLGVMNLISPFVVLVLIEKLGRRILLLIGLGIAMLSMLAMTILIQLADQYKNSTILTVSIPFVYIFQIGYAIGSSVTWIIPSELFPQNVRSFGVAVSCVSFWVSQLITVLCYLPFKDAVGVPLSMVPFMAITTLCIAFFYFYLPETKGMSPERLILEQDVKNNTKGNVVKKPTATIAPSAQGIALGYCRDEDRKDCNAASDYVQHL